jgi:ABC-type transport system substrate-binding protein
MARWFLTSNFTPAGSNMGHWGDAEFDRLLSGIENERDPATINAAIAKAHERLVDNPPWLWIVHDLNPRAMTRRVRNVVSPQSWFIDLARIDMAP